MSDLITRNTIAAAIKELRNERKQYPAFYKGETITRESLTNLAYTNVLPAYGWPGGYDLLYYVSDNDQLTGDVLCAGCAKSDLQAKNCQVFAVESSDGYEDAVYCDQCGGQIVEACEEEPKVSDEQAEYDDYHCIDYSAFAK